MTIAIIGTGKVANILANKFLKANHIIKYIVGRNKEKATALAKITNSIALERVDEISNTVDVILLCVLDSAILEITNQLPKTNTIIAHTAGAISKEILNTKSTNYGIIYPLQSITKTTLSTVEIPFIIDGSNDFTLQNLCNLTKTISNNVIFGNDALRNKLHVSAVVVNNFTNYLFALAEDYCTKENIDFKLLLPIIHETATRLNLNSPKDVFTGPAIRNDEATIAKHTELLENESNLKDLYVMLSNSLKHYYQNLSSQ